MELNSVHHCTALTLLENLPPDYAATVASDWMYGVKRQQYGRWLDPAGGPHKHWQYHQPLLLASRRVLRPGGLLAIGQSFKSKPHFKEWFGLHRLWYPIWFGQGINYVPNTWIVQTKEQHPVELRYPNEMVFQVSKKDHIRWKQLHPVPKPLEEMRWLIWQLGLRKGDILIDPCCGIGTTLIAGRQLGLDVLGCDINLGFVKIARERLANV